MRPNPPPASCSPDSKPCPSCDALRPQGPYSVNQDGQRTPRWAGSLSGFPYINPSQKETLLTQTGVISHDTTITLAYRSLDRWHFSLGFPKAIAPAHSRRGRAINQVCGCFWSLTSFHLPETYGDKDPVAIAPDQHGHGLAGLGHGGAHGLDITGRRAIDGQQHIALGDAGLGGRSEEHTSELQSPCNLVCRLLLEKKNQ